MKEFWHTLFEILHVLAAVTWIGSMIYSTFGVALALKNLGSTKAEATNMTIMKKFSPLTWTSLIILILTGIYFIVDESDRLAPQKPAGTVLLIKLLLVVVLIVILFIQVYVTGPKMERLLSASAPKNQENQIQMNQSMKTGNTLSAIHLWAGIAIVILGVVLAKLLG
jgi:putative copper resistance protein D